MLYMAVFQAVVLDPESGELRESRFQPSREGLDEWAIEWKGKLAAVAIEATTGWRWVVRELEDGSESREERHETRTGRCHGDQLHRRRAARARRRRPRWTADRVGWACGRCAAGGSGRPGLR